MKPTTAQLALLHIGESVASSALLTFLVGIFQQLATGQISVTELATVFGSGFVAALGLIYKTVKADPNFKQATFDTTDQLQQFLEDRLATFESRVGALLRGQATSPQMPTAVRTSTPPAPLLQPQPQQTFAAPAPANSFLGQMQQPSAPTSWHPSAPVPTRTGMGG